MLRGAAKGGMKGSRANPRDDQEVDNFAQYGKPCLSLQGSLFNKKMALEFRPEKICHL